MQCFKKRWRTSLLITFYMNNDKQQHYFLLRPQDLVLMVLHLPPVITHICSKTSVSKEDSTKVKITTNIFILSEEVWVMWDIFPFVHFSLHLTDLSDFQRHLKITAIIHGPIFILLWITESKIQHVTALTKTCLAIKITESGSSCWSYYFKSYIYLNY